MITLRQVTGDVAEALAPFRERVEQALAVTRTHAFEDLVGEIERDQVRLFEVVDQGAVKAVTVLHPIQFPQARPLNVWLAAGALVDAEGLSRALDDVARSVDCDRVWGSGRLGWEKVLLPCGWRPLSRSFERMVS